MQSEPQRFVVLGNPGNRRVQFFRAALEAVGAGAELNVVSWIDFLRDDVALLREITRGACCLRIESAGEEFEVEKELLALGVEENAKSRYTSLTRREVARLSFEKGRIVALQQWY